MSEKRSRRSRVRRRKISTQLVTLCMLVCILVSVPLGVFMYNRMGSHLKRDAEVDMNYFCQDRCRDIDSELQRIEDAVSALSAVAVEKISSMSALKSSAEARQALLREFDSTMMSMLYSMSMAKDMYFHFSSNITGLSAREEGLFYAKREDGSLEERPITQVHEYGRDNPENVAWYYNPISAGKAIWINPYYDIGFEQTLISYVMPFYCDGELVGIVGMDIDFQQLLIMIDEWEYHATGYLYLKAGDGHIHYHKDYLVGEDIHGDEQDQFVEHTDLNDKESTGDKLVHYHFRGENRVMAFSTLRNGMKLVLCDSYEEIYEERGSMFRIVLLTTLAVSVFSFLIALLVAQRISKPIHELSEATKEVSSGNLDVALPQSKTYEVSELSRSFQTAVSSIKEHQQNLKRKMDRYEHEYADYRLAERGKYTFRSHSDLTRNRLLESEPPDPRIPSGMSYDLLMQTQKVQSSLLDDGSHMGQYLEREKLLAVYERGVRTHSFIVRSNDEDDYYWRRVTAHLVENPENGHVEEFFYVEDVTEDILIHKFAERVQGTVYTSSAVVNVEKRIVRYIGESPIGRRVLDYGEAVELEIEKFIPSEDAESFRKESALSEIIRHLNEKEPYFRLAAMYGEGGRSSNDRIEQLIQYSYLDDDRTLILVCVSDVTEQLRKERAYTAEIRRALAAAEAANHAKLDFISRISHDIRTPLSAVKSMTECAYQDIRDESKLRHDLDNISVASGFLNSLINDVLDISRIDSGRIELHNAPYLYSRLTSEIVSLVRPEAEQKGVHLILNNEGAPLTVLTDSVRWRQIALNLVMNAIKYTPAGGTVTVSSGAVLQENGIALCHLAVEDTGIGMTEAFLEHAFEPFSQDNQNSARRKLSGGTGLGLYIVKRLVEILGGTIRLESVCGKGTLADCSIPAQAVAPETDLPDENGADDEAVPLHGHVLLAEDNEINAEIASRILEEIGVTADRAEDGLSAVDRFSASSPGTYDMILMDIQMPLMDGYEATAAIRALPHADAKTVPIITMTADAFDSAKNRAIEAGVNDFLTKPLDRNRVKETIRAYLKKNSAAGSE